MQGPARGFLIETVAGDDDQAPREVEHRTFTCPHCNTIKVVPNTCSTEPGHTMSECYRCQCPVCTKCVAPICHACARTGKCMPFEKVLDTLERQQRNASH